MKFVALIAAFLCSLVAAPATAETAREILMNAAFSAPDKKTALIAINRALGSADAVLARNANDQEARLQRALAISYRGKLTRSRSDIMTARKGFEALVAVNPTNPEAQMAIAGWHLGAVIELGPLVAGTMLGARKATGLKALDRSVTLGKERAFFPAVASLHRIQLDPGNVAAALRLAEAAIEGSASNSADRLMQRHAAALLVPLRKGNGAAAAQAAKLLLPFGRLK